MRHPITDGERRTILTFLSTQERVEWPLKVLSELLLTNFGWPYSTGRKRAALVLQELEQDGKIGCRRNGRQTITAAWPIAEQKPPEIICEVKTQEKIETAPRPTPPYPALPHPHKKDGLQKRLRLRLRRRLERGERNEARFHQIAFELVEMLKCLPLNIVDGSVSRSGCHNPGNGKIDLRDSHGEDVTIEIMTASDALRLIYDVKTSQADAAAFNKDIYYFREQLDARLKKAVVVNDSRSETEIFDELLNDLDESGFPLAAEYRKIILEVVSENEFM